MLLFVGTVCLTIVLGVSGHLSLFTTTGKDISPLNNKELVFKGILIEADNELDNEFYILLFVAAVLLFVVVTLSTMLLYLMRALKV